MTAIELRFPTGKCHATPWGRQVNEGAVEWPPSPWRLLRALLAVWHHKFPDVEGETMSDLIGSLLVLPEYRLPPCSNGHTRHYMPAANDSRTKVFDTFVALNPDDPVVVCWPDVSLDDRCSGLLSRLLRAMSYFGRAESWVDARFAPSFSGELNARPLNGSGVQQSQELVRLLTPAVAGDFDRWRATALQELKDRKLAEKRARAEQKGKPPDKEKLTPADLKKIEEQLPAGLFEALHAETNELRAAGWNHPPGSRWVDYVRDRQLDAEPPRRTPRPKRRQPTVARFAIVGAVRPRLTDALWIGERARQLVMGCSKKQNGGTCSPVFSGKDESGTPTIEGAHGHAHFLCESSGPNSHGRITHLTVFAPTSFALADEKAFSRFTGMWGHGGHDLQVVLLGLGHPEDFGGSDERRGESPILGQSNVWVSRTPFVPTRHLHVRSSERRDPNRHHAAIVRELRSAVRLELERRDWLREHREAIVSIDPLLEVNQRGTDLGGHFTSWLKFRRERKTGDGRNGGTLGYGFRMTFDRPVQGPIVLGYGSHYGLGQFVPVR